MISLDLDSTLNDLIYKWIVYINKKNNTNYKVSDINIFDDNLLLDNLDFINSNSLYDNLEPLEGSKEFVSKLLELDTVQIVSTYPHIRDIEPKKLFVKKYFPSIPIITVSGSKVEYTKNTILIDDKLDNIIEHEIHNKNKGIIFTSNGDYNYNKSNKHTRLGNYDDIYNYIKLLNKNYDINVIK